MNRLENVTRGMWLRVLLLVGFVAGCGSGTAPVGVSPTTPGSGTGTGAGAGPAPVALGTAGNYVILAKTAITNTGTSAITGNLGLSPSPASAITGFALNLAAGAAFATSAQVTGNVYAPGYAAPTPANLTTAISDMQTAYTTAAGRTLPDHTELASGNIGGLTLPPGLYKWSNTVLIPSDVTLSGGANDTWIFQIAGGVTQASATRVILTGGALPQNIVWQVAGIVSMGTTAHMEGVVLSQTQIVLNTGASANGRLLAQTQVTLAGNAVVEQ
jgi:ice-binding like protein